MPRDDVVPSPIPSIVTRLDRSTKIFGFRYDSLIIFVQAPVSTRRSASDFNSGILSLIINISSPGRMVTRVILRFEFVPIES